MIKWLQNCKEIVTVEQWEERGGGNKIYSKPQFEGILV